MRNYPIAYRKVWVEYTIHYNLHTTVSEKFHFWIRHKYYGENVSVVWQCGCFLASSSSSLVVARRGNCLCANIRWTTYCLIECYSKLFIVSIIVSIMIMRITRKWFLLLAKSLKKKRRQRLFIFSITSHLLNSCVKPSPKPNRWKEGVSVNWDFWKHFPLLRMRIILKWHATQHGVLISSAKKYSCLHD